jgi:WD40 repeat protein/serine/threonine protein kinase
MADPKDDDARGLPLAPTVDSGPLITAPPAAAAPAPNPQETPTMADGSHDDVPLQEVSPSLYHRGMELARGGMGRIVVARDRRLRRWVAVKELLDREGLDVRRFEREALITARLQHPSIVRVYEAGRWPSGEPFYAMEMVRGQSLDHVLAERRTLDERLGLLSNVLAACDALAYAHAQKIIHRDLKPGNILIGKFGETVVIDWGLAKDLAAAPDSDDVRAAARRRAADSDSEQLTVAGAVMGTPSYMPPEQARGELVDERADVYALGAILYCVLAGRPPYRGRSSQEVLDEVLTTPPPPIETMVSGLAPELITIVARAMAREPRDRYPMAGELAADLRRFLTGQLVASHRYSRWQRLRRYVRRHRAVVAVSAAAALALATTAVVSFQRVSRARDRAEDALKIAEAARREADAERARAILRADELTLAQAHAALERDPSLTVAWAKELEPGTNAFARAVPLAEEAVRRGVARIFSGHGDDVDHVAFSPDGTLIASGADDHTVRLWTVETGASRILVKHNAKIHALAFSPDGQWLASGSVDKTLRLTRVASGESLEVALLDGTVRAVAFSPDGKQLAAAAALSVRVYDVGDRGATLRYTVTHGKVARDVVFSPDGKLLATAGEDGKIGLFDAASGRGRLLGGHQAIARLVRFSPDGSALASGGEDGQVRLWSPADGSSRVLAGHTDAVKGVAFSPDGAWLVSVGQDHQVRLWSVLRAVGRLVGEHDAGVKAVLFSPTGESFASAGSDRVVRLWDARTGKELRTLRGHDAAVKALAWSPDGKHLASSSDDDTVRLWPLVAAPPAPIDPRAARAWLDARTNLTVPKGSLPPVATTPK